MARDDVYFHSNFPYLDGTFGHKYFVVIFEPKPNSTEPYLVLKTTSQVKEISYNIGCNEIRKAFFIPAKNTKVFHIDTLIQLHKIYEFSIEEFLKGSLTPPLITPLHHP